MWLAGILAGVKRFLFKYCKQSKDKKYFVSKCKLKMPAYACVMKSN